MMKFNQQSVRVLFCLLTVLLPLSLLGAEYKYGLSYSSLLNGVKILDKNGALQIDHIQCTFVPAETKGWIMLRTEEGKEHARFDWVAQEIKYPYCLLELYSTGKDLIKDIELVPCSAYQLPAPGKYVLDFYTEAGKFYSYPFTVSQLKGNDPFKEADYWFLDGDWENWGYFYYYNNDPTHSLYWKIWLRNKTQKREIDAKVDLKLIRESTGKVIATNRQASHTLNHSWIRYEFDVIEPMQGESGGRYFKAEDLLNKDGDYTLKMAINGVDYGQWKFTVKEGKFVYTDRTVRDKTDPLIFIEGGADAFWYKKWTPKPPQAVAPKPK